MVRKGWRQPDVPTGWVQILRGPRPKSEKWPVASPKLQSPTQPSTSHSGDGGGSLGSPEAIHTPQAGCAVSKLHWFWSLESSQFEQSSKQPCSGPRMKPRSPCSALLPVKMLSRQKLESCALNRARVAAQERPVTEQFSDCKSFTARAEKRLSKLEAEKVSESALLEEGRARLLRLEAQAAAQMSVPPPAAAPIWKWR